MQIDIHTHVIPPSHIQWLNDHGDEVGVRITRDSQGDSRVQTRSNSYLLDPRYFELERRRRDMESMGVDRQLVSISTPLLAYWLPKELGEQMCRQQNEAISAMVSQDPVHFSGSATVPLQHPEAAARELEYAYTQLGLPAVEISTNVDGRNLDWSPLDEFWAAAEQLRALVFVHPSGKVIGSDRLENYYLRNLIGLPTETILALASIIFGGVLDRHPGLKICFAHGGGFGPYGAARLDHGYESRPECKDKITRPPSQYLRDLFFDTVVHDRLGLEYLIDQVGYSRIVLGSDFPADMGCADPVEKVLALGNLDTAEKESILGGTASDLLGL